VKACLGTYRGTDVTIVILQGGLKINANTDIQISAPGDTPDPSPAIPGVLLYVPASNPADITLNGGSGSFFKGTIIALDLISRWMVTQQITRKDR
jgi:hypothetical protein